MNLSIIQPSPNDKDNLAKSFAFIAAVAIMFGLFSILRYTLFRKSTPTNNMQDRQNGPITPPIQLDERIGPREILQINATIIAGALVLLTINAAANITDGAFNRNAITTLTIIIIMPFALSTFAAFDRRHQENARQLTRWGFVILMIALTALGILISIDQFKKDPETAQVQRDAQLPSNQLIGDDVQFDDSLTIILRGKNIGEMTAAN